MILNLLYIVLCDKLYLHAHHRVTLKGSSRTLFLIPFIIKCTNHFFSDHHLILELSLFPSVGSFPRDISVDVTFIDLDLRYSFQILRTIERPYLPTPYIWLRLRTISNQFPSISPQWGDRIVRTLLTGEAVFLRLVLSTLIPVWMSLPPGSLFLVYSHTPN